MKIFLELDIKPFRHKNYTAYSGLYTHKGKRNQKARIEVDGETSEYDQVDSCAHEYGHMLCDLYNGEAMKPDDRRERALTRNEEMFCYLMARATRELWRRMKAGKLKVGRNQLVVNVTEDDLDD